MTKPAKRPGRAAAVARQKAVKARHGAGSKQHKAAMATTKKYDSAVKRAASKAPGKGSTGTWSSSKTKGSTGHTGVKSPTPPRIPRGGSTGATSARGSTGSGRGATGSYGATSGRGGTGRGRGYGCTGAGRGASDSGGGPGGGGPRLGRPSSRGSTGKSVKYKKAAGKKLKV